MKTDFMNICLTTDAAMTSRKSSMRYSMASCGLTLLFTLLLLSSGAVLAQDFGFVEEEELSETTTPIRIGDSRLYAKSSFTFNTVNNLFFEPESLDPIETTELVVRPELEWNADRRSTNVSLTYDGAFSNVSRESASYTDHRFSLRAGTAVSGKVRLGIGTSFELGHNELGTLDSADNPRDFDEVFRFQNSGIGASLDYGSASAKGNLEFDVNFINRRPLNFQDISRYEDRDIVELSGSFLLRLSPDTKWRSTLLHREVDSQGVNVDRTDLEFSTGLELSNKGFLRGTLSAGIINSTFDGPVESVATNIVVNSSLELRMSSFSSYRLTVLRIIDQFDNGVSDEPPINIDQRINVVWNYQWARGIRHAIGLQFGQDLAECPLNDESTTSGFVRINYPVTRSVRVGLIGLLTSIEPDSCDAVAQIGAEDGSRQQGSIGLTVVYQP